MDQISELLNRDGWKSHVLGKYSVDEIEFLNDFKFKTCVLSDVFHFLTSEIYNITKVVILYISFVKKWNISDRTHGTGKKRQRQAEGVFEAPQSADVKDVTFSG